MIKINPNFSGLGNGLSRLLKSIRFGLVGQGKIYRNYLIFLACTFAAIVAAKHWGLGANWHICQSPIRFSFFCPIIELLLPSVVGIGSAFIILGPWCALLGLKKLFVLLKFENAFDTIGLKNAKGNLPQALNITTDKNCSELVIRSNGIGLETFKEKVGALESALGLGINGFEPFQNGAILKILLSHSPLPNFVTYEKVKSALKTPYSFIVGMSANEIITQSILTLPHMLIAGTTGGGKSVALKQDLLTLLTSSPRIQMYLFDLKGGVELKVFSMLPNVQIFKNEADSIQALKTINEEMDRRLEYLSENEFTKVDFERDKLDLIIVCVDEASELYGKSSDKNEEKVAARAREWTDRLTKLARATGIHVILATQKVIKETIDTRIQANIGGRMVFRMESIADSNNALNNRMGFDLDNIPGRAVWKVGNRFTEVQAPFLSDEELKKSLLEIKEAFEKGNRKNFREMIGAVKKIEGKEPEPEELYTFEVTPNESSR